MKTKDPIRVVVVDDDGAKVIAERLLRAPVEGASFTVETLLSVQAALERIEERGEGKDFDVAVIDMVMPVEGGEASKAGLEVLKKLKDLRHEAEAIVLTGFGSHENMVEAMERGAFSYVDKTDEGWQILPKKICLAAERRWQREELRRLERQAALSLIAGKVIHDMNGPLAVILAWAQLGLVSKAPDAPINPLERIRQEGERLKGMIQEILDVVSGKATFLKKASVDFEAFLQACSDGLQMICRGFKTELQLENQFAGTMEMDAEKVRKVLENLVSNGARAVRDRWQADPQGTVSLRVTLESGRLIMQVSDNGNGMSKELCDRLFFGLLPKEILGHGLGLRVCKEIVEQHGGSITVESELGTGTTFTFSLPVRNPTT